MPGLTEPPNRRERREGVGVNHDRGGVMGSLEGQYLWPGLWGRTAGLESRLCATALPHVLLPFLLGILAFLL